MPSWADKNAIGEMIIAAWKKGLVLDHIVPLRGKKRGGIQVCGLHCEDNLQEMTYKDNDSKSFNNWPNSWEAESKTYTPITEVEKISNKIRRIRNSLSGIKWNKYRDIFEVNDLDGFYVGEHKDYFSAVCLRKTSENVYISKLMIEYSITKETING